MKPPKLDALRARIAYLERENRQTFDEAQREADVLFSQYQLSQLVASGGTPADLGMAVATELARLADAVAGALWLGGPRGSELELVAWIGADADRPGRDDVPTRFEHVAAGRAWCAAQPDCTARVLSEEAPVLLLALWARAGSRLDEDGVRIAQLARHELAVAFQGARLRETLDRERNDLSAIVENATDLILQVDEAGRVVRLNPAAERLLGVQAPSVIGHMCAEVLGCVAARGHAEDACPLREVIADGQSIAYRETAIQGAGAVRVNVAGSYFRSPPEAGGGVRATGILRDISALRTLEELREGFVATVSHELRTPLALVKGYVETLLYLDLSPEDRRLKTERIHAVTERLTSLVNQILDVAYLTADPLVIERAPTSFVSLVARLRGDLSLAGGDGRLVVDLPDDLPPIEVDAGRVGRVLENLVDNGLKYGPPESRVVIRAEPEGDWLVVHVDDSGIGIPETERALVLEPFHRAWNVRESRTPGTGLGLHICLKLVEAHGGRLWVEEPPGGRPGTRVTFTLPLSPGRRRVADDERQQPRPSEAVTGG